MHNIVLNGDELHLFHNVIPFSPLKCPEKLHEANFRLADQSLKTPPITKTHSHYLRSRHLGGFDELSDDDGTAGQGAACGWRGAKLGYD